MKNNEFLTAYPNPSTGLFTLKLPELVTNGTLTIFDYTGKQILQQPIKTAAKIDITSYAKGIYFYRVETEKELFTGKIIKN
ncbi:MAG: T9SS type A sorting domain-containing protein [Vicingaceae bacterium]|nr:T9SS type A sorting domain-containing protein [Vicingaceae bacterium]